MTTRTAARGPTRVGGDVHADPGPLAFAMIRLDPCRPKGDWPVGLNAAHLRTLRPVSGRPV